MPAPPGSQGPAASSSEMGLILLHEDHHNWAPVHAVRNLTLSGISAFSQSQRPPPVTISVTIDIQSIFKEELKWFNG